MHLERDGFVLSDDKSRLDVARVHGWIASTYWAKGIPLDVMQAAIAGSDCFGIYLGNEQLAFARVVTDRATFAYLCDVFVDDAQRGKGLGEWLVSSVHQVPAYRRLRRWMLATRDAHGFYERLGWTRVTDPLPFMQRHDPEVYSRIDAGTHDSD